MDIGSSFSTVFALVVGWTLNELSASIRLRREDRRVAGPLLGDLLEIRHQLFALDAIVSHLGSQLNLPAQAQLALKQYICQLLPNPLKFSAKFEEAVTQIARVDPILAFRLRGQPIFAQILPQARNLATADEAASKLWQSVVEPGVLKLLKPQFEELILDVARAHGWWSWFRTRRRLRRPMELDQIDKDRFSAFITTLKTASVKPPDVTSAASVGPSPKSTT